MQLQSVWTDVYASTLALYAGRAGGHRWLVAAAPHHALAAGQTLAGLDGKGETVLLAFAGLTPLAAALGEQSDRTLGRTLAGVLVIDRDLAHGSAVVVAHASRRAGGGLDYIEGGGYPAWTDALGEGGAAGECPPASVCAALGLPVRVCAPERLHAVLCDWWAATPHALTAG